ncbi:hypothetical protein ABT324_24385 [Saccharopolyspora sp. NPDC000359]|uniref:hypothetical protein n=1 Tax=Saccharopolyspora sp. NPDC000359 TaxID=3154251 RepID=UPI00331AC9B4
MRSARKIVVTLAASVMSLSAYQAVAAADETSVEPRTAGEIAECLVNPAIPNAAIVDRVPVSRPDTPQREFQLECGPMEIAGARHIHAGHPINNAVTFQRCYSAALVFGEKIPQQYSSLYRYTPAGGPTVEVATDDFDPFVLSAWTKGPNSADWDGCSAAIP